MGIKKITFLFFITLTSCFSKEKDDVQKEYQYNDFPSSMIEYENVFNQEEVNYLVYIYSLNCRHCQQIKNDVLSFVENGSVKTYLVSYTKEIKVDQDIEKTIGVTTCDDLFIAGTPTLIHIYERSVISNVVGEDEVLSYLSLFANK